MIKPPNTKFLIHLTDSFRDHTKLWIVETADAIVLVNNITTLYTSGTEEVCRWRWGGGAVLESLGDHARLQCSLRCREYKGEVVWT